MDFDRQMIGQLRGAQSIVVFTGAGVSQESGIPTFRDALTGLWEQYDAQRLATPLAFAKEPDLVWGWYEWRRALALRCRPNPAHLAIASMAGKVPWLTVITQNVDDLHERAGSTDVIHLHGSLHAPRCRQCGRPHTLPAGIPDEPEGGRRQMPPLCIHCGSRIRPGVVWFGENLPAEGWRHSEAAVKACDVLFSIGTSSLVYPAAELPRKAVRNGACVIQVNPGATKLDIIARYILTGRAGDLMPALVESAWG
jgi:NAD-dependent deacetylase